LAAEALFELLGIQFAKDGSKYMDFGDCFKSLGLVIKVGKSTNPFEIGHTLDRRLELQEQLNKFWGPEKSNRNKPKD